jgi:YfiH family protein
MSLLDFDWPGLPSNVKALSTTRARGWSKPPYDDGFGNPGLNLGVHVGDDPADVARNRASLRRLLPTEPAWLTQVHGTKIVDASATSEIVPEADASFAATPGAVCVVMTADCLPVLLADCEGKVVGAAHAGWRGLAAGVLESSVNAMCNAGAGEITAWLGPAIGPSEFEVGSDVVQAFTALDAGNEAAFVAHAGREGKFHADIYQLARRRLAKLGVTKVHGGQWCTVADPRFYSFRRDKVTGRMASLIWMA